MKKILLETNFTYSTYVKSIPFRIIAFIGIIIILAVVNIDYISETYFTNDEAYNVGVYIPVDSDISQKLTKESKTKFKYVFLKDDKSDENIEKLSSQTAKYDIIVIFNQNNYNVEFHYNSQIPADIVNICATQFQKLAKIYQLTESGYSNEEIETILLNNIVYKEHNFVDKATINLAANLLIFLTMFIYVVHIGNTITEEKTSRISETLLSYISPLKMLVGKLLGMFLALLTHLFLFTIVYILAINIFQSSDLLNNILAAFDFKTLLMMFCMLIFGYITYGFLYSANSAYVDNVQDIGQATIIQSVLIVIAFYFSLVLQMHYDANMAEVLIYIPFVSVFSNIVYTSVTDPSWLKIIFILLIQIIYTVVIGYICTNRFRKGITKYGIKSKLNYKTSLLRGRSNNDK